MNGKIKLIKRQNKTTTIFPRKDGVETVFICQQLFSIPLVQSLTSLLGESFNIQIGDEIFTGYFNGSFAGSSAPIKIGTINDAHIVEITIVLQMYDNTLNDEFYKNGLEILL